jgi:dTDP-4-dehydrorhamnose 3,5-epimerase
MKVIDTAISEVKIIEPKIFGDDRGFFCETFSEERYQQALGMDCTFVQGNLSRSKKNVLRGLHHQTKNTQGKLVTVLSGEVFDVAVDIRIGSPTFGQSVEVLLSAENRRQLWVPPGFVHGFVVLSDTADLFYKCTNYYDPASELCIRWDDADLNIQWPTKKNLTISDKDINLAKTFKESFSLLPKYGEF